VLASILAGGGLLPRALYTALLASVVVTIVLSTTLVRLGRPATRPAPASG